MDAGFFQYNEVDSSAAFSETRYIGKPPLLFARF